MGSDGQVHEVLVQPTAQHQQDHHPAAYAPDRIRVADYHYVT
jgi:hypothetical protein